MNELRRLTGKQRYWQIVKKVRIAAARDRRLFDAGKRTEPGGATMDRERNALIAEFDRMQRALDEARARP